MFSMRAGGAAETKPDTPEEVDGLVAMLRAELKEAKAASMAAGARYRMLLYSGDSVDLEALAAAGEETGLRTGRVVGLARLLKRAMTSE